MIHFSDYIQGFSTDARENGRPISFGSLGGDEIPLEGDLTLYRGTLFEIECLFCVSSKGLVRLLPQWDKTDAGLFSVLPFFPEIEAVRAVIRTGGPYPGPLDDTGWSDFLRSVLGAVSTIPPGERRTYGWVAQSVGVPQGARAVGRSLSTNPLPLIFPCHRVVRSSGPDLGGYTIGAQNHPGLKKWLLFREVEGVFP